MRAVSLTGVLVLAKALALVQRDLPFSVWLPSAVLWQDVAVGAAFWTIDRLLGRPRVAWMFYWCLVVWVAVNVIVMRELSSPLTMPMLRAAGSALSDSIVYSLTAGNLAAVGAVLAAGVGFPHVFAATRLRQAASAAALLVALPGPFVVQHLDVRGAQRNAVTSLTATAMPRRFGPAGIAPADLRATMTGAPADDLGAIAGAARGRHIILVLLESTGAQYLRSYGAAEDPMPVLTSLAGEALLFETAYAVYPESVKGLFTVLCSQPPAFGVPVEAHAAAPCSPLPRILGDAGYRTALFHSGRFGYLGMDALLARQGFDVAEDAGAIGGNVESSFGVDEPATVARMLAWVDAPDRRPFFLVYMPIAGHHPYATTRAEPFAGTPALRAYKNALRDADEALGALLDGLTSRGLARQILVVVLGDHGEAFGQHDGNYGHTLFAYDENVRVPLLLWMPGAIPRPVRARQVASAVDVAPTLLDLAGLARPPGLRGASLLRGPSRVAFFQTDYALGWAGARDGCWKYLLEMASSRSTLFDVCADPAETRNLAAESPDRARDYHDRTLAWLSASRAAIP